MSCSAAHRTAIAVSSLLFHALPLAGVVSCGDSDHAMQPPSHASGGGQSAGEGGSTETAAGAGGIDGGDAGSSNGGNAGAPSPPAHCTRDSDCDDGLWCNGRELCLPEFVGADVRVCMGPHFGPCQPSDCDEATDSCDCTKPDQDGDHYNVPGCPSAEGKYDCDDKDANRNPGRPEVCDGKDGHDALDEDCDDSTFGFKDTDGDGYIDERCTNEQNYQPLLSTSEPPRMVGGSDCADGADPNDFFIHPQAIEVCDGKDNNCNGEIDEVSGGQGDPHTYYKDADGDLWGDDEQPLETLCNSPPPGYAVLKGDCGDDDPRVNPGREEICNGINDDCNGTTDQPDKPGDLMFGQPFDGVTEFECTGKPGWKVKTCPAGRLDCDENYLDACETIGTQMCNCHACGNTCAFSCGETSCEEIAAISTGDLHTCALVQAAATTSGGIVACWGQNAFGQLGIGNTKDTLRPTRVPDLVNVTALASGDLHSCAIGAGGRLLCWGDNEYGQLGSGAQDLSSPYPAEIYQPPPALKVTAVGSGPFHTCAIFEDGRLECWGRGDDGQLGNRDHMDSSTPVRVRRLVDGVPQFVNGATQVVAGRAHTCALSGGKVECWGDNSAQQLGVDPAVLNSSDVARPVSGLEGLQVQEISASAYHSCARVGADVYCWGDNYSHEIALQDVPNAPPTKIPLPVATLSIATGVAFSCALSAAHTVYCWGSNESGERGVLDNPASVTPNLVNLPNVQRIFGGAGAHVCAAKFDSSAWCWGKNDSGQLGSGEEPSAAHPSAARLLSLSGSQECLSH